MSPLDDAESFLLRDKSGSGDERHPQSRVGRVAALSAFPSRDQLAKLPVRMDSERPHWSRDLA
jgi:hypothetical protein